MMKAATWLVLFLSLFQWWGNSSSLFVHAFSAFSTSQSTVSESSFRPTRRHSLRHQLNMVAGKPQQGGDTQQLSGLVSDMLSHYREQAKLEGESAVVASKGSAGNAGNTKPAKTFAAMPEVGQDGVYRIKTEEQLRNFLAANADKLVILKFSAPWCRVCRGLAEKFKPFVREVQEKFASSSGSAVEDNNDKKDKVASSQPNTVFADFSCVSDVVQCDTLGVVQLPSIHLYASAAEAAAGSGKRLVENFPCGPDRLSWTQLKQKMLDFCEEHWIWNSNNNDETAIQPDQSQPEPQSEVSSSVATPTTGGVSRWMQRINPFHKRHLHP